MYDVWISNKDDDDNGYISIIIIKLYSSFMTCWQGQCKLKYLTDNWPTEAIISYIVNLSYNDIQCW